VRQSPAPPPTPCRVRSNDAPCPCPLSAAPRASPALHDPLPRKGAQAAGPRRRSLRRTVHQTPPLTRQAGDRTPRGARPGRPIAGLRRLSSRPRDRLAFASRPALRPAPSRGASPWWAPLSPGGPALVGFRPSSIRLAGASDRPALAYSRFGSTLADWPTRASPRARHPVTGTPSTPIPTRSCDLAERRLALSRARRTFARRGVLRVVSCR